MMLLVVLLAVALLLATSTRRSDGYGITCLAHAPLFEISWGPNHRWIVHRGFNFVWNKSIGPPGTYLEFPISPSERASLRLWTPRWSEDDK